VVVVVVVVDDDEIIEIVYCSITGFGQTGPRKEEAGYDFMIQGLTLILNIRSH
jgi:crotonobetainyl-CoA:carnitine CoA-transferase CaiB-like acyl-CoA transferase